LVPTGNWEPAVSTQYCGIWTGVLANDRDSESIFHLDYLLAADVATATRAAIDLRKRPGAEPTEAAGQTWRRAADGGPEDHARQQLRQEKIARHP
jgi:hypothetical protein